MLEVSATKQRMVLIGFIAALILVIVMIVVMFFGGGKDDKKNVKSGIDNKKEVELKDKKEITKIKKVVPKKKESKFLKLAGGEVFGLQMKKGTNQAIFYQEQSILSVDPFSGKKYSVSNYPFVNVEQFLWSKDTNKAIIKDSGAYFVYDLGSNLTNKFRDIVDAAIWDKNGNRVIYKYYNQDTHLRKIRISDTDGNNSQLIVEELPYKNVDLTLQPRVDKVCYFPTPDARVEGEIACYSLNGQNEVKYGGQYGQDYLWSPDGRKILTSFTKGDGGNQLVLGVINKDGGTTKGLSFGTTVKKCVWSMNSVDVYCAMLTGAAEYSVLPNDWNDGVLSSVDTFWKINTNTSEKKRLFDLEEMKVSIDAESFIIDSEEEFLFFINKKDKSLWRIKL